MIPIMITTLIATVTILLNAWWIMILFGAVATIFDVSALNISFGESIIVFLFLATIGGVFGRGGKNG